MSEEIKRLPDEIKRKGVFYKLVKREKDVAIYSLAYSVTFKRIIGYDCVKVRKYAPNYNLPKYANYNGKKWGIVERLPSDEEFGRYGWSYDKLESADKKFQILINEQAE